MDTAALDGRGRGGCDRPMTAIPLPADADLDAATRERLAALPSLNVLRMVAHAPPSLQPFFDMGAALLLKAELPARDRERRGRVATSRAEPVLTGPPGGVSGRRSRSATTRRTR